MVERAKKISELDAANSVAGSDYFVVVGNTSSNAVTRRVTANTFLNKAAGISRDVASTLTIRTTNSEVINILSNTTAQLHYNANTSVDSSNNSGNTSWVYVQSGEAGAEVYNNGILSSALYLSDGLAYLRAGNNELRVKSGAVPTSSSSTGTQGQIAFDSNYLYYCIGTNTWKRVALTSW